MSTKDYALITGSSSGIGKCLAEEFAKRKFNILLVALPNTGLDKVAMELRNRYGVDVNYIEVNLIEDESLQKIYEWVKKERYCVRILVNNAGFGNLNSLEDTDATQIADMIALNNRSLVILTQLFISEIKKNKSGYILNVGSLASFMPMPNKAVYAATKSFVYTFSCALRLELLSSNISVSCLCPGGTITSDRVIARIRTSGSSRFCQLPEEVAKEAVRKMFRKKLRIVPGWHNKVCLMLSQWLPEFVLNMILQKIFNKHDHGQFKGTQLRTSSGSFALAFR